MVVVSYCKNSAAICCELLLGVHLVPKNAPGAQAILGALGAAANTSHQANLAATNRTHCGRALASATTSPATWALMKRSLSELCRAKGEERRSEGLEGDGGRISTGGVCNLCGDTLRGLCAAVAGRGDACGW